MKLSSYSILFREKKWGFFFFFFFFLFFLFNVTQIITELGLTMYALDM